MRAKEITWIVNGNGCWICTSHRKDTNGYPQKMVGGKRKYISHIHYEKHKGPIPDGMHVLHNCPGGDNPGCINPEHLWTGTHDDNMKDMAKKGRSGMAKLTNEDILEIRSMDITQRKIAGIFKISQSQVSEIKRYIQWKHVA